MHDCESRKIHIHLIYLQLFHQQQQRNEVYKSKISQ